LFFWYLPFAICHFPSKSFNSGKTFASTPFHSLIHFKAIFLFLPFQDNKRIKQKQQQQQKQQLYEK